MWRWVQGRHWLRHQGVRVAGQPSAERMLDSSPSRASTGRPHPAQVRLLLKDAFVNRKARKRRTLGSCCPRPGLPPAQHPPPRRLRLLCLNPKGSGSGRPPGPHNGPPVPTDLLSSLCQNPRVGAGCFPANPLESGQARGGRGQARAGWGIGVDPGHLGPRCRREPLCPPWTDHDPVWADEGLPHPGKPWPSSTP